MDFEKVYLNGVDWIINKNVYSNLCY